MKRKISNNLLSYIIPDLAFIYEVIKNFIGILLVKPREEQACFILITLYFEQV